MKTIFPAIDVELFGQSTATANSTSISSTVVEPSPTEQSTWNTVQRLFRGDKWRLLLTYGLLNLENLLKLLRPFVLGLAINGLLIADYTGLIFFVVQHVFHMLISSFRQMYDTRVFTTMYSELATDVITHQRGQNVATSRVAARSTMAREYVDFFERYVPMMTRSAYAVVGGLIMLAWYDWTLAPFCLALVVPAVLLNAAYGRKTFELSRSLHDCLENEVSIIQRGKSKEVRKHFDGIAGWKVKLSDVSAINFCLMELFVLGVLVAALVRYCSGATVQPGDIFAVFRYVMMFVIGMDTVPRLVQQVSRMRDIGFRMRRKSMAGPTQMS